MVSCIVARVGKHQVADLAKHSTVPVINALCDSFHPLQIVADFLTIHETFSARPTAGLNSLGMEGMKICLGWGCDIMSCLIWLLPLLRWVLISPLLRQRI